MSPSIASLNDRFRQTFAGGQVFQTAGITALRDSDQAEVVQLVKSFDKFTEDNDPYGEHDFGMVDHPRAGRVFWKIDYYDRAMKNGSEDPADPTKTTRTLTIMLAGEY